MVYSSIIDDGKNFYYVNSAGAMVSNEWREVENTEKFSDDEPDTWWYYLSSNGRKYRFNEYGVANYDWYNDASSSSASYYYSTEEQCWLRTGWFKAYPDPYILL